MAKAASKAKPKSASGAAVGTAADPVQARGYVHAGETMVARPEVGAAPRFRAKQAPTRYRYDSSLSPALEWDENPAREVVNFLIGCIEDAARLAPPQVFAERRVLHGADGKSLLEVAGLQDALAALKRMQAPFLNWTGKAERGAFEVPALPLFVHERLSTAAIIETLKDHVKQPEQEEMFSLFADPRRPMAEQVRAYEYRDRWVNRMILGDSLVVMNSLRQFEGLGGQVQMIYIDPPYGVKFGSNFQPFVRERGNPSDNDDAHAAREPEMVRAYRDTWELGLHSYLTYLRDRINVGRELLAPGGSIFVQISDDNLHHVREVMDEIFGPNDYCGQISFKTTGGQSASLLSTSYDTLLWYAKGKNLAKRVFNQPTVPKVGGADDGSGQYVLLEPADGSSDPRAMTDDEAKLNDAPPGMRILAHDTLYSQGAPSDPNEIFFEWRGRRFQCPANSHWKPGVKSGGMAALAAANRLMLVGDTLRYKRYVDDNPVYELDNVWSDTVISGFGRKKKYVVETSTKVVERCILMTTRPGDLVLDPTIGSGTTLHVAERWGRRWIGIDTSRIPLALSRERLLTATYPWFILKDENIGPSGGFSYSRKRNRSGGEVGGIVPHVTLGRIANNEPAGERVIVDRPDRDEAITRVAGPFVVEATLPTPQSLEADDAAPAAPADEPSDHVARMIEVLRRAPSLALAGNRRVTLKNIRRPGRSLSLSAEAMVDFDAAGTPVPLDAAIDAAHEANTGGLAFSARPVAILFGPADGPITGRAVLDAAKEANVKGYTHLFVIGFAITAEGRAEIEGGEEALGLPATYVTASMDLQMGDLLRNQRSSQIFAVCGLPEIEVIPLPDPDPDGVPRWHIKLLGLDVFNPIDMSTHHSNGNDVPAWMLDTRWNGMVFHADQVFFPRTSAWDSLRRALKATHDDSVWAHLAGDISAPFAAPAGSEIAVKVLDDRGNELPVIRKLVAGAR